MFPNLKPLFFLALLILSLQATLSFSQTSLAVDESQDYYLARIELHTAEELFQALQRSNALFQANNYASQAPVAFVLHGAEAKVFFRNAYQQNQALVDLAAKLSALNVVEIKVCKTWMGVNSLDENQLMPFIGTVRYGPGEEQRLMRQEGYRYF